MSKVEPNGNENPSEEEWYELDETIQNYVTSHIAETDDGLYVLSTVSGWPGSPYNKASRLVFCSSKSVTAVTDRAERYDRSRS